MNGWEKIKYFKEKEFACNGLNCCGGTNAIDICLVGALDVIREHLGVPIIVTSGFRCVVHNRAVGGAIRSLHIRGRAADVTCHVFMDLQNVYWLAQHLLYDDGVQVFEQAILYEHHNFVHLGATFRQDPRKIILSNTPMGG